MDFAARQFTNCPVVRQVSGRPSRAVAAARLLSAIGLVMAGILLVGAAIVVAG